MTKKLLVMTEEKWQRFAPPEQDRSNTYIKVSEFRAAMTEVDLDAIASEWLADETDKSFTEILLAHMEGKEG